MHSSPGRTLRALWNGMADAVLKGNGLAKRLLVAVIAFSSLITAVVTAVELYGGYRHDLREIDRALSFIESSYAPMLAHSLWQFDGDAVNAQLQGLLRLPDIDYAAVVTEGKVHWSAGQDRSQRRVQAETALTHDQAGQRTTIGLLRVVASGDRAVARVWDQALTQLLGNAVKTLLVCLFLLLSFHFMLTRHLSRVAHFVRGLDPAQAGQTTEPVLRLARRPTGLWRPDVLDDVTAAINALLASARQAQAAIESSQARLADSELRFRLGMEASGAGLWDCDLEQRRVQASPDCARIAGIEPVESDSALSFWHERVHPDDVPAALAGVRAHLAGQAPLLRLELRLRHDLLGWRWVVVRGSVVERDAHGVPQRAMGTLQDVDERKRAEAVLQDREEKFRGIAEMNVDVIFQLSADGSVSYVSTALRELYGFAPEHVLGRAFAMLAVPDSQPAARDLLQRVQAGETVRNYALDALHRDGSRVSVEVNATPLRQGGRVVGVQGVVRDITERQRAEEALRDANRRLESRVRERTFALEAARDEAERANRAKSEFLSRMSHELRTPMNAILGFAQILQTGAHDPKQQRWVGEIRAAGDHLLALIDELLDLACIDVGQLALHLEAVELQPVVQQAVAMNKIAADARGIHLAAELPDERWTVRADRTRLRQILLNLLSNAIKYGREGGQVAVHCSRVAPGQVRVSVSDTGQGIAPADLGRLFQPFERLGREDSGIAGTGIGLALSKRLAELMHCDLGAESVEHQGSRFWIDLPTVADPVATPRPAPSSSAPVAHRPLRVLYIEDNLINQALMQAHFDTRSHLELLTASDGPEGVARAKAERPDAILLDIQLPRMNGYEVLQALRREDNLDAVPVIAVTADALPHDVARGKAAGFAAYVAKPIHFGELMQLLDTIAAQPEASRSA